MTLFDEFYPLIKNKNYMLALNLFLDDEYENHVIYPKRESIFASLKFFKSSSLKVVIIGQDPYHEPNQAMGLSFSVPKNEKLPPSLINIFKEISLETNNDMKKNGDLTYLAKQGVLLYNSYLTVRKGEPLSHKIKEYDLLMADLLKFIESLNQPIVFMLWGTFAKKFKKHITNPLHFVIETSHPSPLSANRGGWFNNNQFIKCNEYLLSHGLLPIEWNN